MASTTKKATEVAAILKLKPHPDEGFYSETLRDSSVVELNDDGTVKMANLGNDLESGQRPQYTVPPDVWFGSYPTRDIVISEDGNSLVKAPTRGAESHYSLLGVTCAPAFQIEDSEVAKRSELVARFPSKEHLICYLTYPD